MELVHGMEQVGNLLPNTNPPPRPMGLVGFAPPRIDHIFLTCEDVSLNTRLPHRRARLPPDRADRGRGRLPGRDAGSRCPTPATTSRSSPGQDRGLHHFAWWVDDWNAIRDTADTLAYHGVRIETNPTRHGATRGHCLYFFDPAGNRNEVFTGGYWVDPDEPAVTWTESEMGRAIFYYDGVVNQRFLTVHS